MCGALFSDNPISQKINPTKFSLNNFQFVSKLLINIQQFVSRQKANNKTNRSYCFNYRIVSRTFKINHKNNNNSNGMNAHIIFLKKFAFFFFFFQCVDVSVEFFQNNQFILCAFYLIFFFSDFVQYLFQFIRIDTVFDTISAIKSH